MDQLRGSPHGHAQLLRLEEAQELLPGAVNDLPVQRLEQGVPDTKWTDACLLRCLVEADCLDSAVNQISLISNLDTTTTTTTSRFFGQHSYRDLPSGMA